MCWYVIVSKVGLGGCIGVNAGAPLEDVIDWYPVPGRTSIFAYGVVDVKESVGEGGDCAASALSTT